MENKFVVVHPGGPVMVFDIYGNEIDITGGYKIVLAGNAIPSIELTFPIMVFTSIQEMNKHVHDKEETYRDTDY